MPIDKSWLEQMSTGIWRNSAIKPSHPDNRDWPLSVVLKEPGVVPAYASLEKYLTGVKDQKSSPLCGGYSIVYIADAYFAWKGTLPPGGFSPRWIYHQSRFLNGLSDDIPGTTLRELCKAGSQVGFCPESLCPSWPDWANKQFTPEMYAAAAQYKIKNYARLQVGSLDDIQRAISSGMMVIVGTIVTSDNWADGWIIQPEGSILGGHATTQVKYDMALKYRNLLGLEFINFSGGLNSWGEKWGFGGHYLMANHYAQFKFIDFGGMPALMEAWAVEFEDRFVPEYKKPGPTVHEFDVPPSLVSGRTMVELRSLANIAGVKNIKWDEKTQRVTLEYADKTAQLQIGQREYQIVYK